MAAQENRTFRRIALAAGVLIVAGGVYVSELAPAAAQMIGHGGGMGNGMMHGGGRHDMTNMPGLRGVDATPEESAELAVMFNNFETITRTVENLPNGIRTVTNSSDEEVMANLVSHVTGMINRVEEGRDPQIFIQSPTLDIFFQRGGGIETEIEMTETGIVVIQTSDDPELVAALQVHAAEVTDMANRGMQAVHDAMMKRGG